MSCTDYELRGDVAVIRMDRPPVNSLGLELRRGIVGGLERAQSEPTVKAIVLTGTAKAFCAGADIQEFGRGEAAIEPNLATIVELLDASPIPVVAAIGGICLGGGLELALACHARVAAVDAQVGMPEVKIGLLPGAGGTQRLPRLVGIETALNMIVSGNLVAARAMAETGLFDAVVERNVLDEAVRVARQLGNDRAPPRRVRDLKTRSPRHEAFVQFARNTVGAASKGSPAPLRCVDAVAASVKGFDEGMAIERDAFEFLLRTTESRALRHAFFAERAASRVADVPEATPTRSVASVAVVGAGTMGVGIATAFANAGFPVQLLDASAEVLERALGGIRKSYEATAKKGKLSPAQVAERLAAIQPTPRFEDLSDADLVVEAVFEDLAVKEAVFRKLDAILKPGAILATNTSTLDVDRIAGFTSRPQDVLGMHFFSPANVMRLLEIVRGAATSKTVLATVLGLTRRINKIGVVSGVCYGFIGNRMLDQYHRQAIALLEEGALPSQIDRVLERWGWAMGIFRMSDLAGNDVGWLIRNNRYVAHPEERAAWKLVDDLCEQGRSGQKTGQGWYRYEPGRRDAVPDPAVESLILGRSRELGITRREIGDVEIVQRCALALVNEGARILEEGIAQRASDIDLVYLNGYGFPAQRGGPMFYADTLGLERVLRAMRGFAQRERGTQTWAPSPLLARLAAEGKQLTA